MHKSFKVFSLGLLLLGVVSASAGPASYYTLTLVNNSSTQTYSVLLDEGSASQNHSTGGTDVAYTKTGEFSIPAGSSTTIRIRTATGSSCSLPNSNNYYEPYQSIFGDEDGTLICSGSGQTCSCTKG
jgi:hypothetical protein